MSENRDTQIASLALYLYRQVGCPYGENLSGLKIWIEMQEQVFEIFATTNLPKH